MKYDKSIKVLQVLLLVTLFFGLLTFVYGVGWWYKHGVHNPAMASVRSGCHLPGEENDNYISVGTTEQTYNPELQQSEITVEVEEELLVDTEMLLMVVRHELCHVDQLHRKILTPTTCNETSGKFLRYLNEVECYISQNFKRNDINESAVLEGNIDSVIEYLNGVKLPMSK
jgi:hypothetical protein